jgi:hypothetical protein
MEVQQQTNFVAGNPKLGQHLCRMHGFEALDRLDFHDHGSLNNEIESISAIHSDIAVHQWQGNLTFNHQLALLDFERQTRLIGGFEQSWSEFAVNLNRGVNDFRGDSV